MGSTYLELTNQVLRSLNEVELTPSSFASARGIHGVAKDAVKSTVQKINAQKFEWPFNSSSGSQILTKGIQNYSYPSDFRIIDKNSFYIEKDDTLNVNTSKLIMIGKDEWYNKFRSLDLDAGSDGKSLPYFVYENGAGGFGVTPSPDKAYTVNYTYFTNIIVLTDQADETSIPTEYDYVIRSGALFYMYTFLDNTDRARQQAQEFENNLNYMSYLLVPKDPIAVSSVINFGGGRFYAPFSPFYR